MPLTLIQAIRAQDWHSANEAFAQVMSQKIAVQLAAERKQIFKEGTNKDGSYRSIDQMRTDRAAGKKLCGHCGERWPCTVVKNKSRHNGQEVARHHIGKDDLDEGTARVVGHGSPPKTTVCRKCRQSFTNLGPNLYCGTCRARANAAQGSAARRAKLPVKMESLASEPSDGDAINDLNDSEAQVKEDHKVGDKVTHSGYPFRVSKVHDGQLKGMVDIKSDRGESTVDAGDVKPIKEAMIYGDRMPHAEVQRVFDETADASETELLCGVRGLCVNDHEQVVSFMEDYQFHRNKAHNAIQNPNSSGQGHHPDHDKNPHFGTLQKHGYTYSHSTPVNHGNDDWQHHHTYKKGDHNVSVIGHASNAKWDASKGGSGHSYGGRSTADLDKYLKNRRGK